MNIYSQIIGAILREVPQVIPHLSPETRLALKAVSYDGIRATYWLAVYEAVEGYLSSDGRVTSFRSSMQKAMVEAFGEVADSAYEEGGGTLPLDEETLAWFNDRVAQEMGYIDSLFDSLKDGRGTLDPESEALLRAENYAKTLDSIYSEAKLRGSKNIMVTWHLGATEKHCDTCSKLDGERHKISWFIDRDYIPRKPGNACDCGGYNCDCSLTTDSGEEFTA